MLSSLASAAGLTRPKKKFRFNVSFCLQDLLHCTYVSGVLFAKIRLKDGGSYTQSSRRCDINNHCVRWGQGFEFQCKMYANHNTGELESCICKISIRKESRGGRSYKKLGYVKINLAEYAGAGEMQRKYLLESYNENKHKPDNSILKVNISLKQISGDVLFKAPHARVWELDNTEDEGIQPDIHSSIPYSSHHASTASSLSGSTSTVPIGAGTLSLQDVPRRSIAAIVTVSKQRCSSGSLKDQKIEELGSSGDEDDFKQSTDSVTEDETPSTATPHSLPSESDTLNSHEITPRNLSPILSLNPDQIHPSRSSNSLGSGDYKQRPQLTSIIGDTGVQSLPNRSYAHRRHTSFSGVPPRVSSPYRAHRRQQSLLSEQSSKSTSAYSTLSERSMGSWGSQDADSISGSTRGRSALVPTSSRVEQTRVDPVSVIEQLFANTNITTDEDGGSGRGLKIFVDRKLGTVTVAGTELDRKYTNLEAIDVNSTSSLHSRAGSSSGGSPKLRQTKKGSSSVLQTQSYKESVNTLVIGKFSK